jgi:hypothetical protein
MNRFLATVMLFLNALFCSQLQAETDAELIQEARAIVTSYVGKLRPTLKNALNEGPEHAVDVCAMEAPAIAAALSTNGWQVKRVSLQARNPAARPDEWERTSLNTLAKQLESGVEPGNLNLATTEAGNFRYLQAQITDAVCLVCHGKNISPSLADTITRHYPEDQATGYDLGQVRGAISVSKRRILQIE